MADVVLNSPFNNLGNLGGVNMLSVYAREVNWHNGLLTATNKKKTLGLCELTVTHTAVTNVATATRYRPFKGQTIVVAGVDAMKFDGQYVVDSIEKVSSTSTIVKYYHWNRGSGDNVSTTAISVSNALKGKWAYNATGGIGASLTNWNSAASDTGNFDDPDGYTIGKNKVLKIGNGWYYLSSLANYDSNFSSLYDTSSGFTRSVEIEMCMLAPAASASYCLSLISGAGATGEKWLNIFNAGSNIFISGISHSVLTTSVATTTLFSGSQTGSSATASNGASILSIQSSMVYGSKYTNKFQFTVESGYVKKVYIYNSSTLMLALDFGDTYKLAAPYRIGFGFGSMSSPTYNDTPTMAYFLEYLKAAVM